MEEIEAHWKPPFTPMGDGSFTGYFSFTDDSRRKTPVQGRPSKLPAFERFTYHFDEDRNPVVTAKEPISYEEIVTGEDYCIV